jgi:acyl-CoA reductase-like NAD-dependent aldehyde dehydrogenase
MTSSVFSPGAVRGLFVDGQSVAGPDAAVIEVVDPATGGVTGTILRGGEAEVDVAVRSARAVFTGNAWRRMPPADRGRLLLGVAAAIRAHEEELAQIESADVGKPISQGRIDVRNTARYFEYYGGMADKVEGTTMPVRWGALDFTIREPYGVSAQIVPWNFPLAMAARGIAPALAAGNTVVAKPAEDASLSLLRLAEIVAASGFPAGAFNVVTGLGPEAGAALVRHPLVAHVTFTGSLVTGTAIMKMAADGMKPVALELGGKSPNIVFADADLELAADTVTRAIVVNAGQICNACPRLLVERRIADAFVERLAARFGRLRLGAPLGDPDVGPVNSQRQRQKIEGAIAEAGAAGVRVDRFGELPGDPALRGGFFVQPALLADVGPSHAAFHDEIFGPVLTITPFDDRDEAVTLANATEYGLNAGIFTQTIDTALDVAQRIDAGQIYINGWGSGGSVEVPFGGYKKSGFGREKGVEGLLHYTQVKSVTAHFR